MIDIEDIKRLTLGPGDLLVVKIDGTLSGEQFARVRAHFVDELPQIKGRLLVIDDSITLAVVDQTSVAGIGA